MNLSADGAYAAHLREEGFTEEEILDELLWFFPDEEDIPGELGWWLPIKYGQNSGGDA